MSEAKIHVIGGTRVPDSSSEQRLVEIRQEAERRGEVRAIGIRPSGAPFPKASPETGYYGLPLLKQPPWTWKIPLYFFAGGAAGAAAVMGAIADYAGADRKLVRDARWIAAAGAVISPALLIADLGRPARFLNIHTPGMHFDQYIRELVAKRARGEEPDAAFFAQYDQFNL